MHQVFRCPCGQCSLESYIKVGCPKSNSDSFPYLDISKLGKKDKEDLTLRLSQDTTNMIKKFADLLDEISISLEKRRVPVQRLAVRALSLGAYASDKILTPLLSEHQERLRSSSSIDDAFLVLIPHMSFFNFELLKHITDSKIVCSDDDRRLMDIYVSEFYTFCLRKVFEVPSGAFGQPTSILHRQKRKAFVVLTTKIDREPNLVEIYAIKKKIAILFELEPSTLQLHRIDEGSIMLVFSVPNFVAKMLFPLKPSVMAKLSDEGFIVSTPPATEESLDDNLDDTPISKAILGEHAQMLITKFGNSLQVKGFEGRSLLHHACSKGNIFTAKALINDFPLLMHYTDDHGDSPLHSSSLLGQTESVRLLLFDYHASIFIRNKAGKTALDLAKDDSIKKIFKEYMKSEHKSIQREYKKLQTLSSQKYSGEQIITRVFVLGNPGSGKSTLVESLKRKGFISSFFHVNEADIPLHTAGIVPSIHQSKDAGRLLYYDFAGDGEYYSSHAAILEMVSHSTVGTNVYLIVTNLTKDGVALCNEIGYWLSFISYQCKVLDSQRKLKVVIVLSHSDCLSEADSTKKLMSIRHYLHAHTNQGDKQILVIDIIPSNCRNPRSSKVVKKTLQQICKNTPPYSLSFEATLLHGLLEKDFRNVVACKFQDLLTHIKDTGIYLPTFADALYPVIKELHDTGLLMIIEKSKGQLENYMLVLKPSSLSYEVHQKLFSDSAIQNISSSINPHYANMGILPENYLASILPEHITKECLVQLQYCQEFNHAEVGLNYSVIPDSTSRNNLLYFPALCKLDSEQCNWPSDPKLTFSIGWYTKCTGKFNYFPARFSHVLLLRLAFAFALPIADCNMTESNELSALNRRCTMWKNGIHWLMEEGVECIFEIVDNSKGIVVITKSMQQSKECIAAILGKIINKVMQAKAEFCDTVSLHHFLLNSGDISSFMCEDKLFEISEVEHVIREGKESAVSVSGRALLDSSHLFIFRKLTYWGRLIIYLNGEKSFLI